MHYIEYDVQRLVQNVPYKTVGSRASILRLLRKHLQAIEAWRDFIPLYASVRCEPLDFLYLYLQCVAALDELLMHDLINEHFPRWRPIVVAAWLAALAPRDDYHDMLVEARPFAQHVDRGNFQPVVDLALAAITGQPPPELTEHHMLLEQLRGVLASTPKPAVRLRRMPEGGEEQIAQIMLIRDCYREHGAEAARITISGTLLRCLTPGLSRWKDECILDSGDGRHLGPNREIWYWNHTL